MAYNFCAQSNFRMEEVLLGFTHSENLISQLSGQYFFFTVFSSWTKLLPSVVMHSFMWETATRKTI